MTLKIKQNRKLFLFDLDKTLLSVNCSFYFGAYLYRHRFFKMPTMVKLVGIYALHKAGFFTLRDLHLKIFNLIFYGKNANLVKKLIKPFTQEFVKNYSYLPAVTRLKKAKQDGHFVCILSNSPDFLVASLVTSFDIDEWRATVYEVESDACFSKISSFVEGADKANYLNIFCEKLNLVKEDTIAYSDSFLDLPFLKEAGVAVAVNPDRKLKQHALKNHWEII